MSGIILEYSFCRIVLFLSKGRNDGEVDRTLADFLHYVANSREEVYMRTEERERLIEVQEICPIAETFAPEYDMEQIYWELKSARMAVKL